ncbi:MAG: hypothetical protein U0R80_15105 [Nocardioidaceae bacterium]
MSKRDVVATVMVAVAGVLYVLWLADPSMSGLPGTRTVGVIILALGFVASAAAVVPGFGELLHGNRTYLVTSSLLGTVALVAGVVMLWTAADTALTVLMVTMAVLWVIATAHHARLTAARPHRVAG